MAGSTSAFDVRGSVDPRFDRWQWRIERVAWVIMGMLVLLALLGTFGGGGPVATASHSSGETTLHYSRLVRFQGTTSLRVETPANGGNEVRIALDREYAANLEFENISPHPDRVEVAGDDFVYVFNLTGGARNFEVVFRARPDHIGVLSGELRAGDHDRIKFWQFAFP